MTRSRHGESPILMATPDHPITRPHPAPALQVLCVEDTPCDARLVRRELEKGGFEVVFDMVTAPEEFAQALRSKSYDVVLADYNLPGWSGMEALEALQRLGADIPFILVTGALGEEAAVEFIKKGATDYVLKDRLARLPFTVERVLEEKSAREERRRAEALLHLRTRALEAAANGVIVTDRNGRIIWVNEAFTLLTGYTRDEAVGQNPRLIKSGKHDAAFYHHLWATILAGEVWHGEIVNRRKDGSLYTEEMTIAPVRDSGGAITNFIAIKQDVTERKRAEEAARKSELQYRGLFAHMSEGLAYCRMVFENGEGRDFVYLTVNGAFETLTGLKDVTGKRVTEVIPGFRESNPELLEIYARVSLTGVPAKFETFVEALGMWFSISVYSPEKGFFVAVFDVITDRKRAEEEIRKLNESLERRVAERTAELATANQGLQKEILDRKIAQEGLASLQRQTELILNSAGEGIFRVDIDGKCTFANPAGARMLGYSADELIGQDLHVLSHHTLPDGTPCPREECSIYAALKLGVVSRADGHLFQRKDGSVFPVDSVTTPIVEQGGIIGAVMAFRDVSEQRAMEKMKDEFVSVVSHELRTPLTAIRAALGLLAGGKLDGLSPPAHRMLDIAVNNTDRLVRLVNDILDSQRLGLDYVAIARKSCTAADLIQQAVDLMRPMADGAGVNLEAEPRPLPLYVEPDAILQTLTNLLSNAIKFSPSGSTVRLEVRPEEGEALFRVVDQGLGIPQDKLESIFGRFQPVDASDSRRRGGTGLGLSICSTIVQRHGGRIWAESEPGRGSTFAFTLPLGGTG